MSHVFALCLFIHANEIIINYVLLYCHKEIFIVCLTIGYNALPVSTKKQLDRFSNMKQESLQTTTRSFSNIF